MKKIIFAIILLIAIFSGYHFYYQHHKHLPQAATVSVKRSTITEQALAVGDIEPKHTITITSTIPGTVKKLWHIEGDYVQKGETLLEISPNPTPEELDEAKRDLQQKQVVEQTLKEHYQRYQHLLKLGYIAQDDFASARKDYQTASLQRKSAEEKFALLSSGKATIGNQVIKNSVTSPISGYILTRQVSVGDPVVPQTESQAGNTLFTIADMHEIIFKGQVNEIDVGKITLGMPATITLGAFANQKITGKLTNIALQSTQSQNNTANSSSSTSSTNTTTSPFNVGFPVTIDQLAIPKGIELRSGYSANAEIIIKQASQTLILPERVIDFSNDQPYVWLPGKDKLEKHAIKVGISDGMNAEILSGLNEGDKVLDQNPETTSGTSNSIAISN